MIPSGSGCLAADDARDYGRVNAGGGPSQRAGDAARVGAFWVAIIARVEPVLTYRFVPITCGAIGRSGVGDMGVVTGSPGALLGVEL